MDVSQWIERTITFPNKDTDTLFDDIAIDLDAQTKPVRRPAPQPIDDSPSPFGSVLPEGYSRVDAPIEDSGGLAAVRFLTGGLAGPDSEKVAIQKAKRYDPRNHYPRTYKALAQLFPGGMFWRADYVQPTASGMLIAKDTLGFADVMGMEPGGRLIAAQVTSYGSIGAHLRKYTDPTKTHGSGANAPSIESLLRQFLATGGRLLIFGFALPEGKMRWEHEIVAVTPQLLDEYVARKRKPKEAK